MWETTHQSDMDPGEVTGKLMQSVMMVEEGEDGGSLFTPHIHSARKRGFILIQPNGYRR